MTMPNLTELAKRRRRASIAIVCIAVLLLGLVGLKFAQKQLAASDGFRIGEKLTYNVSFGQFQNVAYAELFVVSRGKLSGRDAIEIRGRLKTLELFGAQFFSIDESRTTFASVESGFPLFISKKQNHSVEPVETTANYLASPASSYDLLTLIEKIRDADGVGSFNLTENDKTDTVTLAPAGTEKVKTSAGEFDTSVSTVESSLLLENGVSEAKIYLSADERRLPVLFTFKAKKQICRASLASIDTITPEPDVSPTPTPVVAPTPVVIRTPLPSPTPLPYIPDRPLSADLPFSLGETLDYRLSSGGREIGVVTLSVKERKLFAGKDSLLLTAEVKKLEGTDELIDPRDVLVTHVNPDLLAPQQFDFKFAGGLASFSQTAKFDQNLGTVTSGAGKSVDIPVGTHDLLSFLYAVRTFNLKQIKDLSNPVNDTRVAVFWDSKPYIFTLRPTNTTLDDPSGRKRDCVLVAVNTGNQQLDQLGIKIWLGGDARRIPMRIVFGRYQADLVKVE